MSTTKIIDVGAGECDTAKLVLEKPRVGKVTFSNFRYQTDDGKVVQAYFKLPRSSISISPKYDFKDSNKVSKYEAKYRVQGTDGDNVPTDEAFRNVYDFAVAVDDLVASKVPEFLAENKTLPSKQRYFTPGVVGLLKAPNSIRKFMKPTMKPVNKGKSKGRDDTLEYEEDPEKDKKLALQFSRPTENGRIPNDDMLSVIDERGSHTFDVPEYCKQEYNDRPRYSGEVLISLGVFWGAHGNLDIGGSVLATINEGVFVPESSTRLTQRTLNHGDDNEPKLRKPTPRTASWGSEDEETNKPQDRKTKLIKNAKQTVVAPKTQMVKHKVKAPVAESDEEVEEIPKKSVKPKKVVVEEETEKTDSEEETPEPPKKSKIKPKKTSDDDEEDEPKKPSKSKSKKSSDDDEVPKKSKTKKTKAKKPVSDDE